VTSSARRTRALSSPAQAGLRPFCYACGWRKGGTDSWDGAACKCGYSEPAPGS
jgi:hypothetical protein